MLTFGKYRNKSIDEVYMVDKQYLNWLNTQPWFKIKFKELHGEVSKILLDKKEPIIIKNDSIIIYTDGACSHNGSKKAKAGIGVHFSLKNKINMSDISERLFIEKPTNNKAELIAIEKAIERCIENKIKSAIIFTDSDYSKKSITLWFPEWLSKNNLEGKKNIDILKRINELLKNIEITFEYIKAHSGLKDEHSIGNSIADSLATGSIK